MESGIGQISFLDLPFIFWNGVFVLHGNESLLTSHNMSCFLYIAKIQWSAQIDDISLMSPEPVFKIFRWKTTDPTNSTDTVRYSWKRDGFPRFFQKESTPSGNSYSAKEEGRPNSFAQVSVQNIQEMDTKGIDSQEVSVLYLPPILQICVDSLSWLFPTFLCFKYRLWFMLTRPRICTDRLIQPSIVGSFYPHPHSTRRQG